MALNTTEDVRLYLEEELRNIALEMQQMEIAQFRVLYAQPTKLADGMVVYADGVHWNPGNGEGLYERTDGAWVKLGIPYSEVVWTPTLTFGGNSVGITYSTRTGGAVRNGKVVNFRARVTLTSKGSSVGVAAVTGLPFPSLATQAQLVSWSPISGMSFPAQGATHGVIPTGTASRIDLYKVGASGNEVAAADTDFSNTSDFFLSGSYFVE